MHSNFISNQRGQKYPCLYSVFTIFSLDTKFLIKTHADIQNPELIKIIQKGLTWYMVL